MVLSKRERYIGIATAVAVGLLILNSVVLDPLLAEQQRLDLEITKAQTEQQTDSDLLDQAARLSKRWRQMYSPLDPHSPVLADESKATSQLYNNISAWSREAGLNPPPSLKSDRAANKKMIFSASAFMQPRQDR